MVEIEKQKAIQLADQTRAIEIALRSKDQSEAEASKAKAEAVRAEEQVTTVREVARAERDKNVLLVNSALRYRAQAPLLDNLMKEIGLKGHTLNGLTDALGDQPSGEVKV
ncbi:MAG: hypothetical protein U1F68_18200 [Gammaproteobacteria bacterium]